MLLEMKNEKTTSILFLHKHSKFLSVLVWQKLKQKPLISEEWSKLRQWNNENQLSFLEEEEKISLRNIWRNKMKILLFSHGIQFQTKRYWVRVVRVWFNKKNFQIVIIGSIWFRGVISSKLVELPITYFSIWIICPFKAVLGQNIFGGMWRFH